MLTANQAPASQGLQPYLCEQISGGFDQSHYGFVRMRKNLFVDHEPIHFRSQTWKFHPSRARTTKQPQSHSANAPGARQSSSLCLGFSPKKAVLPSTCFVCYQLYGCTSYFIFQDTLGTFSSCGLDLRLQLVTRTPLDRLWTIFLKRRSPKAEGWDEWFQPGVHPTGLWACARGSAAARVQTWLARLVCTKLLARQPRFSEQLRGRVLLLLLGFVVGSMLVWAVRGAQRDSDVGIPLEIGFSQKILGIGFWGTRGALLPPLGDDY